MEPKTLIFLHYFGGSKESWNWTISNLDNGGGRNEIMGNNYNCIAINLPGFGGNKLIDQPSIKFMANYVMQQIREMNVTQCILVGHSMGGKVAVQTAIMSSDNDLISELILVAPSPPSIEEMPEEQQEMLRTLQTEAQAIKNVDEAIVKELGVDQYNMAVNTQMQIEVEARRWWVDEGAKQSIAKQSKDLVLPITVIASKTDPAITYEMTIKETIPNLPKHTKLIVTTGIGHLIPLEDPIWLAETIKSVVDPIFA